MKPRHSLATAMIVVSSLSGSLSAMTAKADETAPAPMPEVMDPTANQVAPKTGDFAVDLGGGLGWGRMGVSQGDLPSRSMGYISLTAFPTSRLNSWLPSLPFPLKVGVSAEYRFVGQSTDSSTLPGNSNFRGHTFLLGIGAQGDFSKFAVSATFDFIGSHTFSNPSAGETNTSYSAPLGFRVTGTYEALKNFYPGLTIGYESFGTFNENGNSVNASSDRLYDFTIGAVATYRLNL
jgi:hypothetical protein